jgi:hypothetical protein
VLYTYIALVIGRNLHPVKYLHLIGRDLCIVLYVIGKNLRIMLYTYFPLEIGRNIRIVEYLYLIGRGLYIVNVQPLSSW